LSKGKEEAPQAFLPSGQERPFFRTRSRLLSDKDAFPFGGGNPSVSGGFCSERQMLFFPSAGEPFPVFFVFSEDVPVCVRYFEV